MERMSKEVWVAHYGHLQTIGEKRDAILQKLKQADEHDRLCEKCGERRPSMNGWFPLYGLQVFIAEVMGWVAREEEFNTWAHGVKTAVEFDPQDSRVQATVERMVAQGYIRISKSGRAFKIIKTA